ncbi:SDR family NAD(P)-dependent oxidoreductase [Streptomyces sp. NPDC102381]|uniref:SDR family NAD(P)-dependent oxidoreductase n=1 Tax=Streptomyces sp. NPDC102381 TaxID=3366164 RepID=UPI00381DB9BA
MSTHGLLAEKNILVAGASSGIGAAAARLFAREGARVGLLARRQRNLEDLAADIRAEGGTAVPIAGDVTDPGDVERAVRGVVEEFGRLDGAFNNAGTATVGTELHEMSMDDYDLVMDTNVRGTWNCLQHEIRAMLGSGGGSIVNTSSVAGLVSTGVGAPYMAAKHAVIGLTKAAAHEYGERGIRVNALAVGSTLTEMMEGAIAGSPGIEKTFFARAIQQRMASPDEIGQAAAWLLSDRSTFVTGATMPVEGGTLAV